jgi:serine/threonine-protein kinase
MTATARAVEQPVVFGRYQLLEPIARGGMAQVYRARLVAAAGTEKVLCIKRILPSLSESAEFVSLFIKEAGIALSLTHANIVQVFDFGEVDGQYFLAMELVNGQDLARVLERLWDNQRRLKPAAALQIAAEVCKGLQYAHGYVDQKGEPRPIVHRDATPHNIMISYAGEVKLTDFGIALAATAAEGEQVIRGKACFMSPEQLNGGPGDPRSDFFTLGAVLYEMLTGVRPFAGDSDEETLRRVGQVDVAPPSEHDPELGQELDQLVMWALARDPADRPPDAAAFLAELVRIMHQRWPGTSTADLAQLMGELFSREKSRVAGGGGALGPRDRLLVQLAQAGVELPDPDASTSELLEQGTVAIEGAAAVRSRRGRGRLLLAAGVGAVLLVGALALLLPGVGRRPVEETGEPRAGARALGGPIAHRRPPAGGAAPAAAGDKQGQPRERPAGRAATSGGAAAERSAAGPAHRRGTALLNCNSWPWSVVYLNGRRLKGNTPLFRVRVSAGRHRLRFDNPELGLSKEVTVKLRAGETRTVSVTLQR